MKKSPNLIIIGIIIIIIVAIGFYALGNIAGIKSMEQKVAHYKSIIDYYFPMPEKIDYVDGKITNIQDKTLSIETTIQDPYTLPENWKTKIVKVRITDETKISEFTVETGESREIGLTDFKIGDEIRATAKQDIKDKTEFEAESIELFLISGTETE